MAAEIKHITDFPDKVNPMVVKELRQGLRGVSFVILFIAIQAALALILLTTAAAASYENAGNLISRIIFFFFSVAVLVIQPLRGIPALSSEIKGNTIDLLCLTRLSAWRIAFGKWVSIISQSALILTAIIPYLILRYFFGDMQLFAEILMMFTVFLISCAFTAFTVGMSGTNSIVLRVLVPLAGAVLVFGMIWGGLVEEGRHIYPEFVQMFGLYETSDKLVYLGFAVGCIYTTWMLLDLGTSMIAPIAENRATMRRAVSLALIVITLLAFYFGEVPHEGAIIIGIMLCLPVSIISLTENPQLVPPVVAPFVRKGILGKIAGRFLYPGWASGLIFTLMLYGLLHGIIFLYELNGAHVDHEFIVTLNSIFATCFMSLALTRFLAGKREYRFALFLLFGIAQFLIVIIIFAVEEFTHGLHIIHYFCWIPTSFIQLLDNNHFSEDAITNLSYGLLGFYALLAATTTGSSWKHMASTEKSLTEPDAAPDPAPPVI
ncbi:MAG: hypothetical protein ACPG32_03450 [Akkermansiaceae bacterium]